MPEPTDAFRPPSAAAPHREPDVRVTLLTPPGRGALAVVGVVGPGAERAVAALFTPRGAAPLAARPAGAVVFGRFASCADGPGEDLVVVRRSAADLEIHCHGGLAAPEAVLRSLELAGARRQGWREWLRDSGADAIALEAQERLAACGGAKGMRILARQLGGDLADALGQVADLVTAGRLAEARAAVGRLRAAARVGLRLAEPWRVVLAGPVNAGKSSLVNALAGHARSIVSPEPGTTRDVLDARIVLDGWEVDLVDTAGSREGCPDAAGAVEREGMARAVAAREAADLVLWVVDASRADALPPAAAGRTRRDLVVLTKADLLAKDVRHGVAPAFPADWIRTSALAGTGIDALAASIVRRLVPEEADAPDLLAGPVPFAPRHLMELERLLPGPVSGGS